MTASIRLPRMLSDALKTELKHDVEGETVSEVLVSLFGSVPGLRHHILDESGAIRPHVSIFVDGAQADLETAIDPGSEIRILHAVSGG